MFLVLSYTTQLHRMKSSSELWCLSTIEILFYFFIWKQIGDGDDSTLLATEPSTGIRAAVAGARCPKTVTSARLVIEWRYLLDNENECK